MVWLAGPLEANNTCLFTNRAGVPHVILPAWLDHYNFARTADQSGIGIYACQKTVPAWTKECLIDAFRRATDGGPLSHGLAEKAKEIRARAMKDGHGRDVAAARIAGLAHGGI
jgi:hypothetical protein